MKGNLYLKFALIFLLRNTGPGSNFFIDACSFLKYSRVSGLIGRETKPDFSLIEYGARNKCLEEIRMVSISTREKGLKLPALKFLLALNGSWVLHLGHLK